MPMRLGHFEQKEPMAMPDSSFTAAQQEALNSVASSYTQGNDNMPSQFVRTASHALDLPTDDPGLSQEFASTALPFRDSPFPTDSESLRLASDIQGLPQDIEDFLIRTGLDGTPLVSRSTDFILYIHQLCVNLENARPHSESYQRFGSGTGADSELWSQDSGSGSWLEDLEKSIGVGDDSNSDSESGSGSWSGKEDYAGLLREGDRVDEGGSGQQLTLMPLIQPTDAMLRSMAAKAAEAADLRISECMLQRSTLSDADADASPLAEPEPEQEAELDSRSSWSSDLVEDDVNSGSWDGASPEVEPLVRGDKRGGPGMGDKPDPGRVARTVGAALMGIVAICLALGYLSMRHRKKAARVHSAYDVENPDPDQAARQENQRLANAQLERWADEARQENQRLANAQLERWADEEDADKRKLQQIRARIEAEDAMKRAGRNVEQFLRVADHCMNELGTNVKVSEDGLRTDIEGALEQAESSRLSDQNTEPLSPTAPPHVVGDLEP